MRKLSYYCLITLWMLFAWSQWPSSVLANSATSNIRGVVKDERHALDTSRNLLSSILFIPRQTYNASMYGVGKLGKAIGDPKFIEKVEDALYLYKKDLLWFPVVNYASGFRPTYGAGLYYSNGHVKGLVKAELHDSDHHDYLAKFSFKKAVHKYFVKAYVSGRIQKQDDIRFHGIGGDPENDSRNRFVRLTDQEYGVLTQTRKKVEWGAAFYDASRRNRLKYMGFFDRKNFENSGIGDNDLEDVFDLSHIPGFSNGPVTQVYNEVAYVFDSRKQKKEISPGVQASAYYGISAGIDPNPADLWKAGADMIFFVPIYKKDRVIVPRLTLDYVDNLNNEDIPFSEYTKHSTFRGVYTREWVRNDQASIVPSLEYKWPVSQHLSAHVFVDYLAVGKNFHSLDWDDGIWAVGGGLDFSRAHREWARLQVAGGSKGLYFKMTVGKPFEKNSRSV